jgi:hypothetical protein
VDDPIDQLLELENLFLEKDIIRLLAYDAVSRGRRVKVFPDGKEPICNSFFVFDSEADWTCDSCDSLLIATFKSEKDNQRLKKSGQVMLIYEHGRYNLEARRLQFLAEERVNGNPVFRLGLPKIYQVAGRRKLVRHRIPAKMPCMVLARKKHRRGDQLQKGRLFDIHSEGFCYAAPTTGASFEKGDQIKLSLETRLKHFGVIHTIVQVLSKVQYRRVEGGGQPHVYYGCRLLNVHDVHLLELYISDIKAMDTEVRKAAQTFDLKTKLFGKIKKDFFPKPPPAKEPPPEDPPPEESPPAEPASEA